MSNMPDEERAVLEFFGQKENLPLTLSVAELADGIRQRMNTVFWHALHERFVELIEQSNLPWSAQLTEDRNTPECMVGIYLQPLSEQASFLRLMMEQQHMGETLRIYYGVMWNTPPSQASLQLAEVTVLRDALQAEGFRNNENFLAWNWSGYHPRRKDFLQRYSVAADGLLEEAAGLLRHFLLDHGEALDAANRALSNAPRSVAVSLDQLRAGMSGAGR